ncbi:hypothetical protein [Zavarzinia sp. CC-PAN008]|uniref:hypothetical protein n=1 Tax=Zavarzinia sp. CC-PAN008 TaxID=3243332 RepID=UPI003F7444DC
MPAATGLDQLAGMLRAFGYSLAAMPDPVRKDAVRLARSCDVDVVSRPHPCRPPAPPAVPSNTKG